MSQVQTIFWVQISFRHHFENVSLIFSLMNPDIVSKILHTRLKTFTVSNFGMHFKVCLNKPISESAIETRPCFAGRPVHSVWTHWWKNLDMVERNIKIKSSSLFDSIVRVFKLLLPASGTTLLCLYYHAVCLLTIVWKSGLFDDIGIRRSPKQFRLQWKIIKSESSRAR